ncbi:hypothetical protein Pan44_36980 [Caulifigura coniformis]|uniref:AbiJ-NTD3 domain-containing protein n=1 Tax=Caulifigura coniformis TaxID=2527983 RepID=A0A517SHQ0_9PLAN|nr:hypothetical protein [Caulifigura coniformis]QDT55652.1 hypothetical protein Pan44_36980 [Caulifigura coniformis]
MASLSQLIDEIANTFRAVAKAQNLPAIASSFGLAEGGTDEAFANKHSYIANRLSGWSREALVQLAKRVNETYPSDSLQLLIEESDPSSTLHLSAITRQHLWRCLDQLPPAQGKLGIVEFMEKFWPIRSMSASGTDPRCLTAYDEVVRHMINNDDYSFVDMIQLLRLEDMSNKKLGELLEWCVNPMVRVDNAQQRYVDAINAVLKNDGVALIPSEQMSGYPVFRLAPARGGVEGSAKNLIFASVGPKPEIVISDAINNDIRIVKHEDSCLTYNRPFLKDGLKWRDLLAWWADRTGGEPTEDTERQLFRRLRQSLASPPERAIFNWYFKVFRPLIGERLPALIPQVYLHYDPYTMLQLQGERRLPRQRMDFLLLLSTFERVVIEVDGAQHYSEEGRPSPSKYSEMVEADRELRLDGYDVYRFGATELDDATAENAVTQFFTRLFKKHSIKRPSVAV